MAIDDFLNYLGLNSNKLPTPDSNIPYQQREDYLETLPYQERPDYQAEQETMAPMPPAAGRYNLPGGEAFKSQTPEVFDRTSQLVQGLLPGESSGIPTKTKKSDIVSNLTNVLSQRAPFADQVENVPTTQATEISPYQRPESPLPAYESQLDEALKDRENRMNRTQFAAAVTDIIAAGNRGIGLQDDRRDLAFNEMKRMEDLKLKDLNERLGLSGKVLGSEKSKMDLQNMGHANDPNSPISQAGRNAAKELLGNQVPDEILNQMSYSQINEVLGVSLGAAMDKLEARKMRKEEIEERRRERALDRAFEREKLDKSLSAADRLEKQAELKEDAQVRKENRKERMALEKDIPKTENLIKLLEDAKEKFQKYSSKSLTGTGPIATLGGLTKYANDDTQRLDAIFRNLSLDSMTKMFAGMSKAIDTGAERAAFESTQPSLSNDDKVNEDILNRQLEAAKSMLNRQKKAITSFDKYGNFENKLETQTQESQPQRKYAPGSIIKYQGKTYKVLDDGESVEEI